MEKDIKSLIDNEVALIKAEETEMETVEVAEEKLACLPIENNSTAIIPEQHFSETSAVGIINHTKDEILEKAEQKIKQDKIINKHASKLSEVADNLMKVETEKAAIEVQKKDASNKAEKQEIENRLIILRNEAKRLRKAEKHKNKLQNIEIKAEKKQKQWEMLKSTLQPLGYDYVPNFIALHILLALVGLKAFFNGVGEVGTAVLKGFKWFLIIGLVIAIVMIIPVTRTGVLELLGFLR